MTDEIPRRQSASGRGAGLLIHTADNPDSVRFAHILYRRGTQLKPLKLRK